MFVFGNLLAALTVVLDFLLQGLLIVILIDALLSWVRPDPANPIVRTLDGISNFVCNPIRRLFPTAGAGIDFAPLVAMVVLWFLRLFLVNTLQDLAGRMR